MLPGHVRTERRRRESTPMEALGGARAVGSLLARLLVCAALIAALPLMGFQPFGARYAPEVDIRDEAGVLTDVTALTQELSDLRFREDVDLAILILPDPGEDRSLYRATLRYMESSAPEWTSPSDPHQLADGLMLLVVLPQDTGLLIDGGTYSLDLGQNLSVAADVQQAITDRAVDAFSRGQWDEAVEDAARTAAAMIGRPFESLLSRLWIPAGLALSGVLGLLVILGGGRRARANLAQAREHYASVTRDQARTRSIVGTIPTDDPYGALVLNRYRWYERTYTRVGQGLERIGEPRGAAWYGGRTRRRISVVHDRAAALDSIDDLIEHASALLTMSPRWEEAWDNEIGPVLGDLAALLVLADTVDRRDVEVDTRGAREWAPEVARRVLGMRDRLRDRSLTPSAALDELDETSAVTGRVAHDLARRAILADTSEDATLRRNGFESSTEDDSRRRWTGYTGRWAILDREGSYSAASTIRINTQSVGREAVSDVALHVSEPVASLVDVYRRAAWQTSDRDR